jgi:hypothetical protein
MKSASLLITFLSLTCIAQTASEIHSTESHQSSDAQAVISAQFGPQFVLLENFPVLIGDFNADGSEDAAFAVVSRSGLRMESGRFQIFDPSSDYFGIGDPKITAQFSSSNPSGPRYVLIIHGNGKEGWHAKEPKARFVLINLAFDRLSVGHVVKKKKAFDDIDVEETGVLSSFLYWDGHRYKWQPGASEM